MPRGTRQSKSEAHNSLAPSRRMLSGLLKTVISLMPLLFCVAPPPRCASPIGQMPRRFRDRCNKCLTFILAPCRHAPEPPAVACEPQRSTDTNRPWRRRPLKTTLDEKDPGEREGETCSSSRGRQVSGGCGQTTLGYVLLSAAALVVSTCQLGAAAKKHHSRSALVTPFSQALASSPGVHTHTTPHNGHAVAEEGKRGRGGGGAVDGECGGTVWGCEVVCVS